MPLEMELTSRSALRWQIRSTEFDDVSACPSTVVIKFHHGLASTRFLPVQYHGRIDCLRSRPLVRSRKGRTVLQVRSSSSFDDSIDSAGGSKLVSATIPGDDQLVARSSLNGGSGEFVPDLDQSGGHGDGNENGSGGFGGGGGDGEGGGEGPCEDDEEFGPLLNSEQVQQELQGKGIALPQDMLEAAKTVGLRKLFLDRYIELQGGLLGKAMNASSALRNRMLADPTFLFKVFTEIAIDSTCATIAEYKKRGEDFWNEFDFYLSDLMVGIALDVLLVGLLAPFVRFGAAPGGSGASARLSRVIQALPSSIFEAERPGRSFNMGQRISTLFYKAGQYGVAGFSCGLIGQGVASSVMMLKRKLKKADDESEDIKVPNVVTTAALWAVFMGLSSNARYQVINGLERVVEASVLSKQVPQVAMAFTVSIRLANNFFGAIQFVDWARMSGVQ